MCQDWVWAHPTWNLTVMQTAELEWYYIRDPYCIICKTSIKYLYIKETEPLGYIVTDKPNATDADGVCSFRWLNWTIYLGCFWYFSIPYKICICGWEMMDNFMHYVNWCVMSTFFKMFSKFSWEIQRVDIRKQLCKLV